MQTVQAASLRLRAFVPLCEFTDRKSRVWVSHKVTKTLSDGDDEFGLLMTLSLRAFVASCETSICEPLDPVLQQCLTKVDQQAKTCVGNFQVCEKLLRMYWRQLLD